MYVLIVSEYGSDTARRWVINTIGANRLKSASSNDLDFVFDTKEEMKLAMQYVHKLSLLHLVTIPIQICDGYWQTLNC